MVPGWADLRQQPTPSCCQCNSRQTPSTRAEALEISGFGRLPAALTVPSVSGAGQEVEAVFGFCSIRNFTDATDVLKEKARIVRSLLSQKVALLTSDVALSTWCAARWVLKPSHP